MSLSTSRSTRCGHPPPYIIEIMPPIEVPIRVTRPTPNPSRIPPGWSRSFAGCIPLPVPTRCRRGLHVERNHLVPGAPAEAPARRSCARCRSAHARIPAAAHLRPVVQVVEPTPLPNHEFSDAHFSVGCSVSSFPVSRSVPGAVRFQRGDASCLIRCLRELPQFMGHDYCPAPIAG